MWQFYSRVEYRCATSNANGERRFPRRDHGSLAKCVDRMRRGGRVGAAEAIILYRIICPLHWIMPSWRQSLTCLYASSLLRWTLRLIHVVWLKARIVMQSRWNFVFVDTNVRTSRFDSQRARFLSYFFRLWAHQAIYVVSHIITNIMINCIWLHYSLAEFQFI